MDFDGQAAPAYFGPLSTADFMSWAIGEKIAEGEFREVFASNITNDSVIKFEKPSTQYCNVTEWLIYQELRNTALGKWLAPVFSISPGGTWLIQARCGPLAAADRPERVPEFFTDLKISNWGTHRGRPVCFDYGNHRLFTAAARTDRLSKARWRR